MAELNAALSNPRADIAALDALERTLFSLRYAIDEIGSLGPVIDPPKATAERAEALAELERARVEALASPDAGDVLARLAAVPELLSETQRAQVRVLTRDREALVRVPADEQAAFSRLTCEAEDVWRRAKATNDWDAFAPYLDRIVEARRHMAAEREGRSRPLRRLARRVRARLRRRLLRPVLPAGQGLRGAASGGLRGQPPPAERRLRDRDL